MAGRASAFDAVLRGLILLLVAGTPLALGTVTEWPLAAFQWLSVILGLGWMLRLVWVPPFGPFAHEPVKGAQPPRGRRGIRLFGHALTRTGLGVPVGLFLLLVLFQLLPIPHGLARIVDPSTARLQAGALPGLEAGGGVDFSRLESFLLGGGGDEVVGRLLEAPGTAPAGLGTRSTGMRPLSIYPYATFSRLLVLGCLCIVFVVALHVFTSPRQIHTLLRGVVLFGFALALFGIVQRLTWNGRIYWTVPVEPSASPFGPFINHNHFAAFIAMIVPVALGELMDEARRWRPGAGRSLVETHGPEPVARLLLSAFVVGVMAAAVALSASRGAVLALVGGLAVYGGALALRGRIGRPEMLVAALLVVVALGLSMWLGLGPLAEKLRAIGDVESEPSLYSRVLGYRATAELILSHPVAGTGFGTFPQAWRRVYPPGTAAVWHEAHNDYLQLLAEAGWAGFALFAAGAWVFARRYLLPGLASAGESGGYAMQGAAVGIVVAVLHSAVDFPLQIVGCSVLFVVLSAVVVSWRNNMEVEA